MLKLRTINMIDAFIGGAIAVLLPLLLVSRKFDVGTIGLVLSIAPAVFVISRLLMASVSDIVGTKRFFIFNSLGNVVKSAIYALATTPPWYAVGKFIEGAGSGAIWAVNRTAAVRRSKERDPSVETSRMMSIRVFALAFAVLLTGYFLQSFSFETALFGLAALGAVSLLISLFLEETHTVKGKLNLKLLLAQIDPRKKPKRLIKTSLVMMFNSFAFDSLISLALPLYFHDRLFSYIEIGVILGLHRLGEGAALFGAVKNMSLGRMVWLSAILLAIPLAAVAFSPVGTMPILLILIGASMGLGDIIWEKLIIGATARSKTMSSDIGVLQFPPAIASFFALAVSGFIIQWYGYGAVFVLSGTAYLCYLFFSYRLLRH